MFGTTTMINQKVRNVRIIGFDKISRRVKRKDKKSQVLEEKIMGKIVSELRFDETN